MGALAQARFVRDEGELCEQRFAAKLRGCPHCRRLGTVNAHGFLRGYSETGRFGIVRGRRFYCSNRGRRPGCGRTFSVLLRAFVAGFVVTAVTLSAFVLAVLGGLAIACAWCRIAGARFSRSTGYRLWRRVVHAQTHLRSQLFRRGPPDPSTDARPLAQLVTHMQQWLPDAQASLFAGFQHEFQSGLFP